MEQKRPVRVRAAVVVCMGLALLCALYLVVYHQVLRPLEAARYVIWYSMISSLLVLPCLYGSLAVCLVFFLRRFFKGPVSRKGRTALLWAAVLFLLAYVVVLVGWGFAQSAWASRVLYVVMTHPVVFALPGGLIGFALAGESGKG